MNSSSGICPSKMNQLTEHLSYYLNTGKKYAQKSPIMWSLPLVQNT